MKNVHGNFSGHVIQSIKQSKYLEANMEFKITVLNKNNEIKASMEGASQAVLPGKVSMRKGTGLSLACLGRTAFILCV